MTAGAHGGGHDPIQEDDTAVRAEHEQATAAAAPEARLSTNGLKPKAATSGPPTE